MGKITLLAYFTSSPTIVLYLNLEEIYSKLMKKCTGKVLLQIFQIFELFINLVLYLILKIFTQN